MTSKLMSLLEEANLESFPLLQNEHHASVFPYWWDELPTEDCVKHFLVESYRALRQKSQEPFRNTVRARGLANGKSLKGL
jgi:hypothetical protein